MRIPLMGGPTFSAPTLAATLLGALWSGCGAPPGTQNSSHTRALPKTKATPTAVEVGEPTTWSETLAPASRTRRRYHLEKTFRFSLDEASKIRFRKLFGSSVCGGGTGVETPHYVLRSVKGGQPTLVTGMLVRESREFSLGKLPPGEYALDLAFTADAPCDVGLKTAIAKAPAHQQ